MISVEELKEEKLALEEQVNSITSVDYTEEIEAKVAEYKANLIAEKQKALEESVAELKMEIKALNRIIERHINDDVTESAPEQEIQEEESVENVEPSAMISEE